MFQYNYVIFKPETLMGVYSSGFAALNGISEIRVKTSLVSPKKKVRHFLCQIHFSKRINRRIRLPFKRIWNAQFFENDFDNDHPICFVFYGDSWVLKECDYFSYLREHFPNCKLTWIFSDTVQHAYRSIKDFDITYLKRNFDLILSYNKLDCEKYGLHFCAVGDHPRDLAEHAGEERSDIVFVGKAKERYTFLL